MWECKHCKQKYDFKVATKKANHTRWCKQNPKYQIHIEKLNNARKQVTPESRKLAGQKIKKAWESGSYDHINFKQTGKKPTDETKEKLSKLLKNAHKEGRHPGWKHANQKRRSNPELLFKQLLQKNNLYEKFKIKEQFPINGYFLDFAFLNIKCDIEIDGAQHIRTKKAIEHDVLRDKIMLDDGWIVYRIAVKELQLNTQKVMNDLINFLHSKEKIRKYDKELILSQYKNKENKFGSRKDYSKAKKESNIIKNQNKIKSLKESKIDFSKIGWVNAASKIIGITPQNVKRWMERNMLEFYKNNCYKRKGSIA